jgi:hypothetical protein
MEGGRDIVELVDRDAMPLGMDCTVAHSGIGFWILCM